MKFNILIVDDEIEIINTLTRFLEIDDRFKIQSTTDAIEALDIVRKEKIHILISDIMMPKLNGIDLLSKVKKVDSLIQVITMTAYSTVPKVVSCLGRGANDYILKPFENLEDVQKIIDITAEKLERWKHVLIESKHREIK
jgi:DNA-binding NtrC family response regulator